MTKNHSVYMLIVYFKYMDGGEEARRSIYCIRAASPDAAEKLLRTRNDEITDERIEIIKDIRPNNFKLDGAFKNAKESLTNASPIMAIIEWDEIPRQ